MWVSSSNGKAIQPNPSSHAEARLLRKLDTTDIIYVARVLKGSGELAMARPCINCERKLRRRGVKTVIFSIDERTLGMMQL